MDPIIRDRFRQASHSVVWASTIAPVLQNWGLSPCASSFCRFLRCPIPESLSCMSMIQLGSDAKASFGSNYRMTQTVVSPELTTDFDKSHTCEMIYDQSLAIRMTSPFVHFVWKDLITATLSFSIRAFIRFNIFSSGSPRPTAASSIASFWLSNS